MKDIGARLHVLLGKDGKSGVVIRRGPSKSVCTIGWEREKNIFSMGQWLKGRIYERRSDLSPDGKHLIYFAMNGRFGVGETLGSWTAVSRAPFLKALVLWAKGDCWNGGGLFVDDNKYWLNDGCGHKLVHDSHEVSRDPSYSPPRMGNSECLGVYFPRLVRDGWNSLGLKEETKERRIHVFEKPVGDGWTLRKLAVATLDHPVGKGVYYDQHELVAPRTGETTLFSDWEWAEGDVGGVVFAEHGKLFSGALGPRGLETVHELHDFNGYSFSRIRAPY